MNKSDFIKKLDSCYDKMELKDLEKFYNKMLISEIENPFDKIVEDIKKTFSYTASREYKDFYPTKWIKEYFKEYKGIDISSNKISRILREARMLRALVYMSGIGQDSGFYLQVNDEQAKSFLQFKQADLRHKTEKKRNG